MLYNMPSAKVLQTFESAARLRSFTLASKELYLTQSAVSRQIKSLEDTLGFMVFERDNNRLELSESGRVFYEVVSKALHELSHAAQRLGSNGGVRRIYASLPPTFASRWLSPRLKLFRDVCPAAITIYTHENSNFNTFGDYDCYVAFGSEEMSGMNGVRLFPECIAPACSPALKEQIIKRGTLDGVPVLHTLTNTKRLPYWEQWLDQVEDPAFSLDHLDISSGTEFSTQDQAIIAAISGLGMVIVDINMASHVLQTGDLVPLSEPVSTTYSYWIFPPKTRGAQEDDPARVFHDWIVEQARHCLL